MFRPTSENVFRRLSFMEGEWTGVISNREDGRFTDSMTCRMEDGVLKGDSILALEGEKVGERHFEIWIEGTMVAGVWELEGERTGKYFCEYEEEKDEFLFNLAEGSTSLDYRTIRRIDMMHFITMEQFPKEGTSAVETLQMEYQRTL